MNISDRLKELRLMSGLSQLDLSKAIGISRGYFSTLEKNPDAVNERIIKLYSAYFSVREEWIRTGEGAMRTQLVASLNDDFINIVDSLFVSLQLSGTYPNDFVKLLENEHFSNAINYFCYRMKNSRDNNEAKRIVALLPISFPDYENTVKEMKDSLSTVPNFKQLSTEKSVRISPAGKAAAGSPVFDNDVDDVQVSLPEKYLDTERYKYIEVKGDSMEPHIFSGDYAVVAIDVMPEQGGLALVYTSDGQGDDGYLLKLYRSRNGDVQLSSYNEKYPPITLSKPQIVRLEKVVFIARAR